MTRFIVIGLGNMGRQVGKLLKKHSPHNNIVGVEKNLPKGETNLPFTVVDSISKIKLTPNDCSILCIKPQDLHEFSKELNTNVSDPGGLISVLAGISTETLGHFLPHTKICRAMPNLAMDKGKSDTAFYTNDKELGELTNTIFSHGGSPIKVNNETDIDVATAIIGSGPAFILKLCQAMSDEADSQRVPTHLAPKFAMASLKAAASMEDLSTITQITSKGGTTENGINIMNRYNFDNIIKSTIRSCIAKSHELDHKTREY
ncbi:MAG: pyrroline-5-carboxylate reductase dimerization domain-containing protein [Candidatus Neomarinimicrobiota bacterium]